MTIHRLYLAVLALVGGVVAFGAVSCAGLIVKSQSLDPTRIAWGGDNAYVYTLKLPQSVVSGWFIVNSDDVAGDFQQSLASALTLYEDGKPLGPAHGLESTIRRNGGGAFSHCQFARGLQFSTSDNSDPRSNGRHYVVRYPIKLAPGLLQTGLLLALSLLLLVSLLRNRLPATGPGVGVGVGAGGAKLALGATLLAYAMVEVVSVLTHGHATDMVSLDGLYFATVLKDAVAWTTPLSLNAPVPMGGLFNTLPIPTNIWANPGWLFYLLLGAPWGQVLAQVIFSGVFLIAAYAMARAIRLPRLWSVIVAQALLLPIFQNAAATSHPGLALIAGLMIAVLMVAVRFSEFERPGIWRVAGAGVLVAVLIGGASVLEPLWPPIFLFGMAPLFLPFVLSRNPGVLAARIGVFVLALLLLVVSGLPDYAAALAKFLARASFSSEIYSEIQDFNFAGAMLIGLHGGVVGWINLFLLTGWLAALFGSPALLQRRLGLACLIQSVVALLYGAAFLLVKASWAGLPLPGYLDAAVFPIWMIAAVAGWRALLERGVALAGRGLRRDSWSLEAAGRPWGGYAMTWPLPVVLLLPCVEWLSSPVFSLARPPSPVMTEITDHLALQPGQPFRGAATVILGVDDTPYDKWKFVAARHAAEMTFGPSFSLPYLWSQGVPTLEEYGWMVTPQLYYVNSRLFSRSFDYQSRNLILPTRIDVGLFRAFGIRYVVTDRYSGAAIDPSARKMTIGGGAGAMEVSLFELDHPNLGNYSPTRVIGVAGGPRAIEAMGAPSFDPEHAVVALEPLPDGLVPARDGGFAPIRNGFHITATSDGWSLLLLPIQYSHCLGLEGGGSARIVRADLVLTGILFQGSLDTVMRYGFGYWSTACRKADAADMARFSIKADGTIKLPPFLNPHAVIDLPWSHS